MKLIFTKNDCVPCKAIKPYVLPLGFTEVNVEDPSSEELVTKYQIRAVPTVIIQQGDSELIKLTGQAININAIKEALSK